jgi:gliding motility-associated-like protein
VIRIVKYLIVFIFFACDLQAQVMNVSVVIKNSECNGQNNGKAEINVTGGIPPYTYLWNFGSEEKRVSGLAPGNYFVDISDAGETDTTVQVTILESPCEISASHVFTPNNDSYNDTWFIGNIKFYPDNLILVFNRWGQKVYESKGMYEPWDGKDLLNVPVPDNSYYYLIYENKEDKEPKLKGTVSIVR